MGKDSTIIVSAPGKVHLLGEHAVVYGKPAILTAVNLRVYVVISKSNTDHTLPGTVIDQDTTAKIQKIVERVVKKHLKIKSIPSYQLSISSQIPIGSGLGSSAAVSAAYIAALLIFLKINWDLDLVNNLAYETEKVFHGNPSGGDNSTVVFGGLVWFRKESADLRIIQPLQFTISSKLAKNFILINTGKPQETTKEMVGIVNSKFKIQSSKFKKLFDDQEKLVRELLPALHGFNEKELIRIIQQGEKNLETMGVCSNYVKGIIRKIEKAGGAAKICGAGGKTKSSGILLCYHKNKKVAEKVARSYNLPCFSTQLGVEGIKIEK